MQSNFNFMVIVSLVLGVVMIILEVVMIIARWRIFTKANQPGWKSLIPIYSEYTDFNLSWDGGQFIGLLTVGIIIYIMNKATLSNGKAMLGIVLDIIFLVCMLIALIVKNIRLARCFDKSTGFAMLLTFIPPVGYAMLAFGDDRFDRSRLGEEAAQ